MVTLWLLQQVDYGRGGSIADGSDCDRCADLHQASLESCDVLGMRGVGCEGGDGGSWGRQSVQEC